MTIEEDLNSELKKVSKSKAYIESEEEQALEIVKSSPVKLKQKKRKRIMSDNIFDNSNVKRIKKWN